MKNPKVTSTTYKKPRKQRPRKVYKMTDGKNVKEFVKDYTGQDPRTEFHPEPTPDIEKVLADPVDEYSGLKYPPPKKHPTFRRVWGQFIESITTRDNFKVGHLNNLEILCDLYVEYETLQEFIRTKGRSYLSTGRQGDVWKFYPEVHQLSKVQANIKSYTSMLNLAPKKDHSGDSGGEKSEWE